MSIASGQLTVINLSITLCLISRVQPVVKVSACCQGVFPLLRCLPVVKVFPCCQGVSLLSRSLPVVKVSAGCGGVCPSSHHPSFHVKKSLFFHLIRNVFSLEAFLLS